MNLTSVQNVNPIFWFEFPPWTPQARGVSTIGTRTDVGEPPGPGGDPSFPAPGQTFTGRAPRSGAPRTCTVLPPEGFVGDDVRDAGSLATGNQGPA